MEFIIINPATEEYFTMLGTPHFTTNKAIAQRFDSAEAATLCTEQEIDSSKGFDKFGMIFTEVVPA